MAASFLVEAILYGVGYAKAEFVGAHLFRGRDYAPAFKLSREACIEELRELIREHPHEKVFAYCLREGGDETIGSDGTPHYRRSEVR